MANTLKDGVLSFEDVAKLFSRLEIFLDDVEVRKVMSLMDGGDDRLEEKDFISFVKKDSQVSFNKAKRLRECAITLRAWIQRNSNAADGTYV